MHVMANDKGVEFNFRWQWLLNAGVGTWSMSVLYDVPPPPCQKNATAGIDMEESLFWSPNLKQNAASREEV